MKKPDLKPGMVVEYANGKRRLVIEFNNQLALLGNDNWGDLELISEDLEFLANEDFTINKVYNPGYMQGLNSMLESSHPCIWERPKSVELTMEDIAEKFGINVEQLKIKK